MPYEHSYNHDLARKLARENDPKLREDLLDKELGSLKERALHLAASVKKMSDGYEMVLEGLSEAFPQIDLTDPNLVGSPKRMARALVEVCSGLGTEPSEIFRTSFPAEDYNQVIILKDINFTSLCSHHFFPFTGLAHVGYLPKVGDKDSRVVGLSKLARIVDVFAQRPQLQERLSFNVMKAIEKALKPAGVMVVVKGQHGCLNCRGARKAGAEMITSALSGRFEADEKVILEFLNLIKQ